MTVGDSHSDGPTTVVESNTSALAVGAVIASLKDRPEVDAAFETLTASQLAAVMKSAKQEVTQYGGGLGGDTVSVSYNTKPFAAIIEAAATCHNAKTKESVYQHGQEALRDMRESHWGLDKLNGPDEASRVDEALAHLKSRMPR